jgi:hypothetical protein
MIHHIIPTSIEGTEFKMLPDQPHKAVTQSLKQNHKFPLLKMPPALKTKPVMTSEETFNITS